MTSHNLTERQKNLLRSIVPGLKNGNISSQWTLTYNNAHISSIQGLGTEGSLWREIRDNITDTDLDLFEKCSFFTCTQIDITGLKIVYSLNTASIINAVENNFGNTEILIAAQNEKNLPEKDTPQVYISSSHQDIYVVEIIIEKLRLRGISAGIAEITNSFVTMSENIDTCGAFLVVMSSSSYTSRWVQSELSKAQQKGKPIFPILIEGKIWPLLQDNQNIVDMRDGGILPDVFFTKLAFAIQQSKSSSITELFISYSRLDWNEYVAPLVNRLQKENVKVWVDQYLLQGGQDWLDKINEALEKCNALILCVSPEAIASKYVKMEYRYFFDENKPVIPFICRDTKLPAELRRVQYLRYSELSELVQLLKKKIV